MYIYTMYIFKKKKINIYTGLLQVNLSCSMHVSSIEFWGRCGFYVQSYCFYFAQLCEGNEFEECTCPMFFWFLSNWIHASIKWKCKWFTNCIYLLNERYLILYMYMKFKWMKESYWLTFVRMIWWINVDCFMVISVSILYRGWRHCIWNCVYW